MTIARPLLVGSVLGVFMMFSMIFLAVAFNGPSQAPPNGNGAIITDTSNNLALGTSTTQSNTKLYIMGSSNSAQFGLRVTQQGAANVFAVRNDGHVYVGVGIPGSILDAQGSLSVVGTTTFNGQTYTWPATAGTASSVLMTNGAGVLSWSTSTGGGGGTTYQ